MPSILTIDFESFYSREFSLTKLTTEAYVRSPLFETIGVSFKINDGPTTWFKGPDVAEAMTPLDWSDKLVLAQNCAFDAAILAWRYNVKPLAWLDTLGMSRALFPHEKSHSLAAQAKRMGIGTKGDEVLNALGKRYVDFSPEELQRYGDYCMNDTELTYALFQRYMAMGFPKQELKLIDMTIRMFVEPVLELDAPLLRKHLTEVRCRKQELLEAVRDNMLQNADPDAVHAVFTEGLEGIKKLLMSNPKFAAELERLGVEPPRKISPTTGKETWAFAKTDEEFKALEEHPDEAVQALVAGRLGNKSTIEESRTETLIDAADHGALAVPLRYFGALTGRWSAESSGKINLQNLPRTSKLKQAIRAPVGTKLCGADLSNIELRLGLWLAGQDDRVQMLANGMDLYKDFAADVFNVPYEAVDKQQRQVGKVSNLSLIYGTGAAKLKDALRIMGGVKLPLEEVKPIVDLYRRRYSYVVSAWAEGERALHAIVGDQQMPMLRGGICTVEGRKGIRRPSGMYMQYPNLRRETNPKTGKPEWVFDSKRGPERIYGSKVFQGATQAIARDIMAVGMLRLDKAYPVRMTVHDSAYWLAAEEDAEHSLAFGIKCLTDPIAFCPGLPLAAEGSFGDTLLDC